jgi:hypothetical protein
MVHVIVVLLYSGRQGLWRGKGTRGPLSWHQGRLRVPFFGDGPPDSTSFLEGSSMEGARRSAPRAGPRVGGSHQPRMLDTPINLNILYNMCQWLSCWLLVYARTPALPEYELRILRHNLAVHGGLLLRESYALPLLVMHALWAQPALEPRKPVRLWSVGRDRHASFVIMPLLPPLAHQLCSHWSRGVQVSDAHTHQALPGVRAGDGRSHLGTADLARVAMGPAVFTLAVAPVYTPVSLNLVAGPRPPPPGTAPSAWTTPHAG